MLVAAEGAGRAVPEGERLVPLEAAVGVMVTAASDGENFHGSSNFSSFRIRLNGFGKGSSGRE